MDLRSRLIAPSFYDIGGVKNIFDIDAFIKRTILFDTYIVDSRGLAEVPHLIRVFGFDGFLAILEAGVVRLNCMVKTTASLGPNYFINEPLSDKIRPPLHYSFAEASTGDLYHNLNLSFQRIAPDLDISKRQFVRMRKAIYSSLEKPQEDENRISLKNTKDDLVLYPDLLAKALAMAIRNKFGVQVDYQDIKVDIQYENDNDFYVTSNIQKLFSFDISTAHKVIETACLAIAKRNDRIEQMRTYSALSGFNDIDVPIFGDKLTFLASAVNPSVDEKRFQRVIELIGLPQFENGDHVRISAKKLLEIRESTESKEFRQWLRTTDGLSDADIVKQVQSLSGLIGRFIGGKAGKNLRFLVTNGVGFTPVIGSAISIPLSVLDQFLFDKIFPRSGVAAFINDMYPSVFEE